MARFLADENVPGAAITMARLAGIDIAWIHEIAPGASDEIVLSRSLADDRVLVTFDKDFGELGFRRGQRATTGVILLRPRLRSPEYLSNYLISVLEKTINWEGHFAVARETNIRVVPLP